MAETPDEVRRDIELTRERMSTTLDQLERKLNVTQLVRENPWPAIGVAVAAGFVLSGSRADVRAAAATVAATRGASGRLGPVLDDLVAQVVTSVSDAFESRVTGWIGDIRDAVGSRSPSGARPSRPRIANRAHSPRVGRFADMSDSDTTDFGGGPRRARAETPGSTGYGTGPAHANPPGLDASPASLNPGGLGGVSGTERAD